MMKKLCEIASFPLVLVLVAVMLLQGAAASDAAFSAMRLSASVVIPSLFPFAVLSSFLVLSGAAARWAVHFGKQIGRLFGIHPGCTAGCILGMLCGYPIGASVIAGLYERGLIDRDSAERVLPSCSNASPAFIVAVAGASVFGNRQTGWLLLAIHLLASVMTGLTLRKRNTQFTAVQNSGSALSFPTAFTEAVRGAALTMVQVSGFIVLFSVVLSLFRHFFLFETSEFWAVAGLMELTNGLSLLKGALLSPAVKFIAASAMLGWSGFCVHFQVLSFTLPLGLSPLPYLTGKLLHGLYAALISLPIAYCLEIPVQTAAYPSGASFPEFFFVLLWTYITMFLFFCFLWKSGKISAIMRKTMFGGR